MGNKSSGQLNKSKKGKLGQTNPPSNRLNKFKQQKVFDGEDDRERLQQKDTIPFIGFIRGKFKSSQNSYIGTGIIISQNLVLTVAHNVCSIKSKKKFKKFISQMQKSSSIHNSDIRFTLETSSKEYIEFAQWLQFYPSLNGQIKGLETIQDIKLKKNQPQNYYKIQNYKIHPLYLSDINFKKYDLCLMHLQKPIQLKQKIKILQNYTNINTQISVFGYPMDLTFKQQKSLIKIEQLGAKGRFKLDEDSGYINYKIATSKGQSGSPIFINTINNGNNQYFCIGVHCGNNLNQNHNIGIHLNQQKLSFIAEAQESLTGKISKIQTMKFPKLPQSNIAVLPPKNIRQKTLDQYEIELQKVQVLGVALSKLYIYHYKQAALICLTWQNYQKAILYYEKFIKAIEELPQQNVNEDDEDQYQISLINLAKSYCQLGKYQISFNLYEKAEKKCKEFYSYSTEKQSTILNNKGAVLVHLEKFEEALLNFKTSYLLRKNKFGEQNLMTYNSLENVTSMKFKLSMDLDDCLKDYEKVFKFKQKKFGVGSPQALKSKSNIAITLFQLKKYKQSLQTFYYCLQKFTNLTQLKNKHIFNDFINLYKKYMREICKSQCNLQDLKYGFHMCQKFGLNTIGKQLEDQWSKRKVIQQK